VNVETKRLLLLRHAKSSWDDPNIDDHDRPLNGRGRRAAAQVGRYLRDEGMAPAVVLCSSALRTRQTLELLELDGDPEVLVEPELYGASAGELLDRLHRLHDATPSVLLIGHNPGMHDLAVVLTGDHDRIPAFPTAALAELSAPIATWPDLEPGGASLERLVTPKDLG
jgi:phosphohistidine phosphatase